MMEKNLANPFKFSCRMERRKEIILDILVKFVSENHLNFSDVLLDSNTYSVLTFEIICFFFNFFFFFIIISELVQIVKLRLIYYKLEQAQKTEQTNYSQQSIACA